MIEMRQREVETDGRRARRGRNYSNFSIISWNCSLALTRCQQLFLFVRIRRFHVYKLKQAA